MREFIATRKPLQWAALVGWAMIIAAVAYIDVKEGKTSLAVAEVVVYSALFVAAAWMGYKKVFG